MSSNAPDIAQLFWECGAGNNQPRLFTLDSEGQAHIWVQSGPSASGPGVPSLHLSGEGGGATLARDNDRLCGDADRQGLVFTKVFFAGMTSPAPHVEPGLGHRSENRVKMSPLSAMTMCQWAFFGTRNRDLFQAQDAGGSLSYDLQQTRYDTRPPGAARGTRSQDSNNGATLAGSALSSASRSGWLIGCGSDLRLRMWCVRNVPLPSGCISPELVEAAS